jgi:hypothetical protein
MPKKKAKKKAKVENPFTPIEGFEAESYAFETLVKEYFGKDHPKILQFSYEADQLVGHDDTGSFSPTGEVDEDDLDDILSGNKREWGTDTLLEKLVADGVLEAGTYFISTC